MTPEELSADAGARRESSPQNYSVIQNGVAQQCAVRRSREAADTNGGVFWCDPSRRVLSSAARGRDARIEAAGRPRGARRAVDRPLSTVTADASLVASCYTRMKNAVA